MRGDLAAGDAERVGGGVRAAARRRLGAGRRAAKSARRRTAEPLASERRARRRHARRELGCARGSADAGPDRSPAGAAARLPVAQRRRRRALRAAVAGLVERVAQAADDQPADQRRIAEADLGLGRVDVDVDLLAGKVDEQSDDRVAVAGEQILIGGADRADQQPVLHRPAVDEQILMVGDAAVEGRQAGDAAEPRRPSRS